MLTMAIAATACGGDDDKVIIGGGGSTPINTAGQNTNRNTTGPAEARERFEFPKLKGTGSEVIVHRAIVLASTGLEDVNYAVEWDTQKDAQRWSCYQLTPAMVSSNTAGSVKRYNAQNDGSLSAACQYPNDQDLPEEYRLTTDPYKYSGYDHGHICPSADRQKSAAANYQTFYITNMQPQYNNFNAGLWERMESKVRQWALKSDTLYVCKGGTIDAPAHILEYVCGKSRQQSRVNSDHVPVPKYFFMAVFRKSDLKAVAFWTSHTNDDRSGDNLANYAISVDRLEQLTGIDFFCNLPDAIENAAESVLDLTAWEL